MGKNKRPAFVGESRPCLYFILATCVAIGYHFAVNKWLTDQSHAQLFLPLVVGALAFLAAKCSTKKMCGFGCSHFAYVVISSFLAFPKKLRYYIV